MQVGLTFTKRMLVNISDNVINKLHGYHYIQYRLRVFSSPRVAFCSAIIFRAYTMGGGAFKTLVVLTLVIKGVLTLIIITAFRSVRLLSCNNNAPRTISVGMEVEG